MTLFNNRKILLTTTAIAMTIAPVLAAALPTGGTVSSGTASISSSANSTNVTQNSAKAVINWTGFNTTSGQQVSFEDASSTDITLNRISGSATSFSGSLKSNGQVWFVNPQGMVFNSGANVSTAGFLATTSNITDANFMAGNYNFTPGGGAAGATIKNQGVITVANNTGFAGSGLLALIGPNVINNGTIVAHTDKVSLASGDTFTVDLAGDGLINLAASPAMKQQSIANPGLIDATGGSVLITAAQASGVLDNLINLDGIIDANNLTASNQSGDLEYGATFWQSTGGNVALSAYRNIKMDSGTSISPQSGKLNVTVDSDDTGAAAGGSIYLASTAGIVSNGGNITLGGGTNPAGGYAVGNTASVDSHNVVNTSGIYLEGTNLLQSDGGNIVMNGKGASGTGSASIGVDLVDSNIITYENGSTPGTGGVHINGVGGNTTGYSSIGVDVEGIGSFSPPHASIASGNGGIVIAGTAGTTATAPAGYPPSQVGVIFDGAAVESAAGGIAVSSNTGANSNSGALEVLQGTNISSGSGNIALSATGQIQVTDIGGSALNTITSGSGNITFDTDKITLAQGVAKISTAASVTFAPWRAATPIDVNTTSAATDLALPSYSLNDVIAGNVIIGSTGDSGAITIAGPYGWGSRNVTFLNGSGNINLIDEGNNTTGTMTFDTVSGKFVNSAGSYSLAHAGRYLIYAANASDVVLDGLPVNFEISGCTYGTACASLPATGNGVVFSQ